MSRAHGLLAIVIVVAVGAAIYAATMRWRVEMPNRTTALILDWDEVQALAAAQGMPAPDLLQRMRSAGATGVAFSEDHLSDLVAAGQVTVQPMSAAGLEQAPGAEGVVLSVYDRATAERLRAYLTAKLPAGALEPAAEGQASPLLIPCRASAAYLETLGLGWPDDVPSIAAAAGLTIAVRMDNYPGVSSKAIDFMGGQASGAAADLVIFSADQVLGHPDLIADTAQMLRLAGLSYGSIELAKQLGDQKLGLALDGALVRVHSITEREMSALSPEQAVARYGRAVRERGIRACYVRLFLGARENPLEFNERYLGALKRELGNGGYRAGAPKPLAPVSVPQWAIILMAAGAVAAAVFALGMVVPLAEWVVYVLFLLGVGAGVGLFMVAPEMARAEKALLASLAFPSIALIAVAHGARRARPSPTLSTAGLAGRAAAWLICACVVSAAGGVLVAGLLTDRLYMTQVLQFMGVKLALSAPLLVVGAVWAFGLQTQKGWTAYRARVQENFRRVWNRPIYVWEAVLAAVLLAATAVMLMRSGNQPPVEVSGLELRVRGILEQIFVARPRTKEFLIGHPALMLAVAMALRGRTRWVLVLLLLGAVGQTSLVNTYCHLHSPIFVSLLRSAHGLWLGIAIGVIAIWVWDRFRGDAAGTAQEQTPGS
jgi:hypothetical protein